MGNLWAASADNPGDDPSRFVKLRKFGPCPQWLKRRIPPPQWRLRSLRGWGNSVSAEGHRKPARVYPACLGQAFTSIGKSRAFGITFPLLLKENGQKFGKSEEGAVWLAASRLSPYKFYQYMVQSTDADVIRFMKMLTFMPMEEIAAMETAMTTNEDYVPNTAQRKLAEETTRFVHGAEGLRKALKATEGLRPGADTVLDAETLEALAEVIPTAELRADEVLGQPVVDVMALAGLQKSKGEAKRLVKGGGARLNNKKVETEDAVVGEADVIEGRVMMLAAGKKNKMLIRIV